MRNEEFQMLAKTFKGLEQVLAGELIELGANNVQVQRRAVAFTGDKRMLYMANFCLRTASRVLVPIATYRIFRPFPPFAVHYLSCERCYR